MPDTIMPDRVVIKQIDETAEGQRIDNFLCRLLKGVPKNHIYQLLRSGQVRVNSKRIAASYHLQLADKVRIPPVSFKNSVLQVKPEKKMMQFGILFEDDNLLVINKPAGVAVHGGSGISHGVIEQLRMRHPDWKFLELVHRLDRETSGVLLLAKKRVSLVDLHRQIREGRVQKNYQVLVSGKWRNLTQNVKFPLSKYVTAAGERRVAVTTEKHEQTKSRQAHTIFTLQRSWEKFSLLNAELKTGRTHQIRVHLAHLEFPIAGDDKYGDFELNRQLRKSGQSMPLKRMFLHAAKFSCEHPLTRQPLLLEAPLTEDLRMFLLSLD
ncbi:MAG: RluA family pseudouridine synthase [Nitrosomonas sp.]|nr:RluA family pseudouridine synthase [Nitrosomonas sp.]